MHPTLLVGPADWDPPQMPREEFDCEAEDISELARPTVGHGLHYAGNSLRG